MGQDSSTYSNGDPKHCVVIADSTVPTPAHNAMALVRKFMYIVSIWSFIIGRTVGHQARVENHCPFPVYLRSVQQLILEPSPVYQIDPGQAYSEIFKPVDNGTGVSIKISRGQSVIGPITQFEYSFVPQQTPNLFYDLSDINDGNPRQFCDFGLALYPYSPEFSPIICPADCRRSCSQVYNKFDDDSATRGSHEDSLTLILCVNRHNSLL